MAKCNFCDRETPHPRGEKAAAEGWNVVEGKVCDEKFLIIGCPDHVTELCKEFEKDMFYKHLSQSDASDKKDANGGD